MLPMEFSKSIGLGIFLVYKNVLDIRWANGANGLSTGLSDQWCRFTRTIMSGSNLATFGPSAQEPKCDSVTNMCYILLRQIVSPMKIKSCSFEVNDFLFLLVRSKNLWRWIKNQMQKTSCSFIFCVLLLCKYFEILYMSFSNSLAERSKQSIPDHQKYSRSKISIDFLSRVV